MMGLRDYIITRIILTIPMILILLSIVFLVMRVLPGNPVLLRFDKNTNPALLAQYSHTLGLDQPIYIQYFSYIVGLFHGDLGLSMAGTFEPVGPEILSRFPATLELTIFASVIAVVVGIFLGSTGARKRGSGTDNAIKLYGILIYAFPVFFLGMLFQIVFGVWLHFLPVYGRFDGVPPAGLSLGSFHLQTGLYTVDSILAGSFPDLVNTFAHLVLPGTALGLVISGVFVRITRANMMETMRADFVTAARARGLKERTVLYGYALRNALLPVVTVIGLQFAILLSGAILTETEFSIQGLGLFLVDRINFRDYTAVQGTIVFLAIIISMVSLVVDAVYAYLDPRVRL